MKQNTYVPKMPKVQLDLDMNIVKRLLENEIFELVITPKGSKELTKYLKK